MLIFLKLALGETSLISVVIIRVKMCNISKIDKKFPISSNSVNKMGKIVRNDSHQKERNVKNKSNCKQTAENCKQRCGKITHRTLDNES